VIGAKDVVARITSQIAACPQQKFALVGYSQGARVVRKGANLLSEAAQDKIVATAVYGDSGDWKGAPKFPAKLLPRSKINCATKDVVCIYDKIPNLIKEANKNKTELFESSWC